MTGKVYRPLPPQEQAWLEAIGYPVPPRVVVEIGTRAARWVGWFMARFDHPPLAVTLGRRILVPSASHYAALSPRQRAALLAHELVHVRQWQQLGGFRFVWQYLKDYLRTRREGVDTHDPIRGIALEREALALEHRAMVALQKVDKPETLV